MAGGGWQGVGWGGGWGQCQPREAGEDEMGIVYACRDRLIFHRQNDTSCSQIGSDVYLAPFSPFH